MAELVPPPSWSAASWKCRPTFHGDDSTAGRTDAFELHTRRSPPFCFLEFHFYFWWNRKALTISQSGKTHFLP